MYEPGKIVNFGGHDDPPSPHITMLDLNEEDPVGDMQAARVLQPAGHRTEWLKVDANITRRLWPMEKS